MNLDSLLGSERKQEFVSGALGRALFHHQCQVDDLTSLVSWSALNHILQYTNLEYPRLKLVSDTKVRNRNMSVSGRNKATSSTRLSAEDVNSAMRDGATLIIDQIDELHAPVDKLCEELERELQVAFQANLYVSCCESPGFDTHWDDHDVIVLQLFGSKKWQVYGPTTRWPMPGDSPKRPETDPIWENIISAGDFLYMPRGWWHKVTPNETPSMHLSIGFRGIMGAELIARILRQLRSMEIMRADYPSFGGPERQAEYLTDLQRVIIDACATPGLILGYLKDMRASAPPRPSFALPAAVTDNKSFVAIDVPLAVRIRYSPVFESPNDETIVLCHNGNRFHFPRDSKPLLENIFDRREFSLSDLYSDFNGQHSHHALQLFANDLLRAGIISLKLEGLGTPPAL